MAGWGPDYADADNFMMLLSCGVNNDFRRECSEVDDKIIVARQNPDPDERVALYREIQEELFGEAGEFPIIPLSLSIQERAIQTWFEGPHQTNGIVGGERYDFYSVGNAPVYVAMLPDFADEPETAQATEVPSSTPTESAVEAPTETPIAPEVTVEPTATPQPTLVASGDCTVHSIITERVNMRVGPGLGEVWVDFLPRGVEHPVTGQARDRENALWWRLETGYWVRYDIVGETGDCASVPVISQ